VKVTQRQLRDLEQSASKTTTADPTTSTDQGDLTDGLQSHELASFATVAGFVQQEGDDVAPPEGPGEGLSLDAALGDLTPDVRERPDDADDDADDEVAPDPPEVGPARGLALPWSDDP
jgi:hypothetical protein